MTYKCTLILNDEQLQLLNSFCTSTLDGLQPTITKIHSKELNMQDFLHIYYQYLYGNIDSKTMFKTLNMGKTKFYKILKALRKKGYPLPSRAQFKLYNPLLNPFRSTPDYVPQNNIITTNDL